MDLRALPLGRLPSTSPLLVISFALALAASAAGCAADDATPGSDGGGGGADAGGDAANDTGGSGDTQGDTGDPSIYWPVGSCDGAACDGDTDLAPSRRSEHAAVYDYDHDQMIVFGGITSVPIECGFPEAAYVAETWIYDAQCGTWREVAGTRPSARGRHMSTYGGGSMWVLGGRWRADGSASGDYTLRDDLWRFDSATETWTEVAQRGTRPAPRINGALVYDERRDRLWLFGGNSSASGGGYTPLSDAWSFDPATGEWRDEFFATAPRPRLFHTALYDYARDRMVITGGADTSAFSNTPVYYSDVWALDLGSIAWEELVASGPVPPGRFWGAWVHDTARDVYVLFGGHDATSLGNLNDVWELDPDALVWTRVATGDVPDNLEDVAFCDFPPDFVAADVSLPERRNAHQLVWSPNCGRAFLFGGKTDCGAADDVWSYADGVWTEERTAREGEICQRWRSNPDNCVSLCL
jgi:hypothetical protein